VAQIAAQELSDDHRLAIVFGSERTGLTGAEIRLCQRTASIPTWPEFPTMNLAQSVAVFCYELGKGRPRPAAEPRDPAPHQLVQNLTTHARALLHDADFFGEKDPERVCGELQAILGRSGLSTREASLLLSMVRKLARRRSNT
jgi:tRNA C32,U32 (ribose-2'-O)-methylase TrmJ